MYLKLLYTQYGAGVVTSGVLVDSGVPIVVVENSELDGVVNTSVTMVGSEVVVSSITGLVVVMPAVVACLVVVGQSTVRLAMLLS